MAVVSSADVQRNFSEYRQLAEQETVHVHHYNKPSVVIITAAEYERLKRRDKLVISTMDTPDWLIEELENGNSEPPEELSYLDGPDQELGEPEGGLVEKAPVNAAS